MTMTVITSCLKKDRDTIFKWLRKTFADFN